MSGESTRSAAQAQKNIFTLTVRRWWKENRRNLPWRHTKNPYHILVSEIMLQQTQVERVIPKYRVFLKQFPTVRALAFAKQADVVRAWLGLGYNRRAMNLHRTAQLIVSNYRGRIPVVLEELKKLPGVGDYTAKAILAFAYNAPQAPVDTNIRRILIRHFGIAEKELADFAQKLIPIARPEDWSQMLMDFGALVCTSRNPQCLRLGLIHIAESPKSTAQKVFKNSNRFWRGRVVAALRTSRRGVPVRQLRNLMCRNTMTALPQKRLRIILSGLQRDGLVRQNTRGRVLLA